MRWVTSAEYAKEIGKSLSTARYRLEKLAASELVERKVIWEYLERKPWLGKELPAHKVVLYGIKE